MKFFLDTANINDIREACSMGLVDGVTTNPSLVSREERILKDLIEDICYIVTGPVSVEILSIDSKNMVKEAQELSEISSKIVIKIPMTLEGLKATQILSSTGIPTNVTLIFSPIQALMAAKSGASYVSPFIGRLDDLSYNGIDLVEQIRCIYSNYDYDSKIIVASVRNPIHILDSAILGADIVTIPFNIMKNLVHHPLTDKGIEIFLKDSSKSKN